MNNEKKLPVSLNKESLIKKKYPEISRKRFIQQSLISILLLSGEKAKTLKWDITTPSDEFTKSVVEKLAHPEIYAEEIFYNLKDNKNNSMDTISIISCNGIYYGISHSQQNKDKGDPVFETNLSQSKDLKNWKFIDTYLRHDSQPSIYSLKNGQIVVMHEKDKDHKSWIEIEVYNSVEDLFQRKVLWNFSQYKSVSKVNHFYSEYFEGTPSLLDYSINHNNELTLNIGFHYYDSKNKFFIFEGNKIDREASFKVQKNGIINVQKLDNLNKPLESNDLNGNYGGRTCFSLNGRDFILMEAEYEKFNSDSWRLFLYDIKNDKFIKIPITSEKYKAYAFANPKISILKLPDGRDGLVFSSFIFDGKQKGQMLCIYDLNIFKT